MPYPWQATQWEQLRLAADRDKLAHALLLSGAEGSGIRQFALEFSRYLLCEAAVEGAACEQCRACILFNAGTHPDISLVSPEEDGSRIKVEAIRELIVYLQFSNQYGRRKIVLIEPAEGMNRHSANGLLKTLEEPAPSTLLILVSYQPAKLPVTIRSRCQQVSFNRVDQQLACDWLIEQGNDPARTGELLEFAGGAPLRALELSKEDALQNQAELLEDLKQARLPGTDPVRIAEKWQKHDVTEALGRLLYLFSKMVAMSASDTAETARQSGFDDKLWRIAKGLSPVSLLECYDISLNNYHLLTGDTNLNKQSLLEEIIVHWQSIHRSGK